MKGLMQFVRQHAVHPLDLRSKRKGKHSAGTEEL